MCLIWSLFDLVFLLSGLSSWFEMVCKKRYAHEIGPFISLYFGFLLCFNYSALMKHKVLLFYIGYVYLST